jgi:hypothetical protein
MVEPAEVLAPAPETMSVALTAISCRGDASSDIVVPVVIFATSAAQGAATSETPA